MTRTYRVSAVVFLALVGAGVILQYGSANAFVERAPGKKCECFDGDARCFFDGTRCPKSNGKCKCFQAPTSTDLGCCRAVSGGHAGRESSSSEAAEFCTATCPTKVGNETCGAQCRLKSGHSGKHFCLKLHEF